MENKINKKNLEDLYPLTSTQEGILFHYLKEPHSLQYVEQLSLSLQGDVDVESIKETWRILADNNEMLRTVFRWQGLEKPVQILLKHHEIPIAVVDLSEKTKENQQEHIKEIKEEDRRKKIDISQEPLRVTLIKHQIDLWEMVITNHHILYDGWSTGILLKEFFRTYENIVMGIPPAKTEKNKFKNFIKWCNSRDLAKDKAYWRHYLEGFNSTTSFAPSHTQMESSQGHPSRKIYTLPHHLVEDMKKFCSENHITMATLLYTGWGILLGKYSNSNDVVFGTTVSGRPAEIHGIEEMMGLFINTLPLRLKTTEGEVFKDVLLKVDSMLKQRTNHENTPLVDIQESSELSNTQLFDNIVVIENYPIDQLLKEMEGTIKVTDCSMVEETNYSLSLSISVFEGIEFAIVYQEENYHDVVGNLLDHYINILTTMVAVSNQSIKNINILSPKETELILHSFNNTQKDFTKEKTLHQLFEDQVEKTPENTALVFENQDMTYRELNEKANQVARLLVEKGVKANTIVGIMVEPSFEMIVGMLGILKAGGAYLPIDPKYPVDRINYMMEDSGGHLLLTQSWTKNRVGFKGEMIMILLDDPSLYEGDGGKPIVEDKPENLAYVIYTSGSTGKPKGVMVPHSATINFIEAMVAKIDFIEGKSILALTTISFDIFFLEGILPLMKGLRVVVANLEQQINPVELRKLMTKEKISMLQVTPSRLKMILDVPKEDLSINSSIEKLEVLELIETIMVGGEALPINLLKELQQRTKAKIFNMYGPTETTIWSTVKDLTTANDVTIGQPIANTQIYIVDQWGKPQPIGVAGELWIGGAGVAMGYLNRPELTAERFVANPFVEGEVIYKTGDLARWLPNGDIQFLGRVDHQVKLRGYRIELQEIEKQLLSYKGIKEAVVAVKKDQGGTEILCGYIVGEESVQIEDLRQTLLKQLPEYMVPSYIMELEKMPLTPNGKVNRSALPEVEGKISVGEYEAPRNMVEETLVSIWEEILSVEGIGINHNFFDLGGHSLRATKMVAKLHKALQVEISLKEIFKRPTIKEIAQLIKTSKANIYSGITPVEEKEYYTTSPAQRRLYTLQQMERDSVGYNMSGGIILEGNLDFERLEGTFKKLIDRHEALRTSFGIVDGNPVQYIHRDVEFNLQYMEVAHHFIKPFDLSKAPLLRVGIVKLSQPLLIFDMHHIISDGTSMGILIEEFTELYRGNDPEPLTIQYKDYSQWQVDMAQSQEMESQKKYWLQQFEGEIPILNLMGDYPRPALQSFEGNQLEYRLSKDLTQQLRQICKSTGTTMYMVILSVFNVLLSRYSRQEDIIVGSPIAGRHHGDLDKIMGMFVNTLAMRNKPRGEISFKDFLLEVKKNALSAYENQDYQFEDLVENLDIPRDMSRNPLFDVMFTMQNMDMGQLTIEGLNIKPYEIHRNISKFDMTLLATEKEDGIDLGIEYATRIFKKETMERILQHLENILKQVVENPEVKLREIEIVTVAEQQQLLGGFNNTHAHYPKEKTLHQLFEEQVKKTPHNIAVACEDKSLTYLELNKKANQVARILVEKGIKSDTLVGIMVERSLEMIIGIMAILKAGGAYVPIDPQYPTDRIQYMLEDSGCHILLTASCNRGAIVFTGDTIYLDDPTLYRGEGCDLGVKTKPHHMAYIIYTSGSTGKPKGVMVQHRNVVRLMINDQNLFDFSSSDVWTMFHSFCFDFSVWEMYGALLYGGKLVVIPKIVAQNPAEFLKIIEKEGVTVLNQTPTAFYNLINQEMAVSDVLPAESIRYIIFGGEALKPSILRPWHEKYPNTKLINMYGITETTVHVTYKEITREEIESNVSNIGKPIPTLSTYVMDENQKLVPIGVPGELCVGGDGVARGYLNKEELTNTRFIENPYNPKERIYRSGDLVRLLPTGDMEYLGRIDHQVKIRGHRIELGEIENRLLNHKNIKDAVVVAKEDQGGEKYLCGYIVAVGELTGELTVSEIRQHLSEELPQYMIPSYIIQLDKMPLTSNGKIDKKVLPEMEGNISTGAEYVPPSNPVEEKLVAIWEELLKVNQVGINDNFFELGGHSLKATTIVAKIHEVFNVEIELKEIFKAPTIKEIASTIEERGENIYTSIGKVAEQDYYPTSPAQRRLHTLHQFDGESIAYNMPVALMLEGDLDIKKVEDTFKRLMERHEALRTSFEIKEGEPVQIIHREIDFKLQYMEVEESKVDKILQNFVKSFDLTKAPLMRVGLVKVAHQQHLLILDMHHIISDGVSMGILVQEFAKLYVGGDLEPLRIQYKEYTQWQKDLMTSGEIEGQKKYWLQQFKGEIPVLNLLGDYPRPAIQSFEGERLSYRMEEGLTNNIRKVCRETGTTMYMVLLSAFNILLSKYSGQEDIIVGSPIAGRPHGELNKIMGMFVNTLAMRNFPLGHQTFKVFLAEVKKNALSAYENQEYQFEDLAESLNLRRDISRNPLFDVMFTMQNMDIGQLEIDGLKIAPYDLQHKISKFDITLSAMEQENSLDIGIEYATQIFKKETMENLYRHLENILVQITENPEVKLKEIQLVTEEEKKQILVDFNNTKTDYSRNMTIQQVFEEQVKRTPNKVAVVFKGKHLTYRELNEKSNQLARVLLEKGVKPDTLVGLMVEKSLEMIMGILAILKAGAAYLPIDPNDPQERISYMMEDSDCSLILTQAPIIQQEEGKSQSPLKGRTVILIDDIALYRGEDTNISKINHNDLNNINNPTDLAYVIYTSGSTGRPKGAMIEHRSVVRLVKNTNYIQFQEDDKILQTGAIVFDAITFEIWGALLNGLELHLVEREVILNPGKLEKTIKENNITILWLTVSLFNQLVQQSVEIFETCRHLLVGGDALTPKFINLVRNTYPHIKIINGYGPTENTTFSTCFNIDQQYEENIPIGKPIANSTAYILDKYQQLQPVGVVGELCLGGDGLARGYLNRPDLTKEKFIHHPFVEGERIYRTGDMARWLPNGNIEFLGRIDHQIKIRGYRIELGEIESQLSKYIGIQEAVVVARDEDGGNKYLCGYITGDKELSLSAIREDLSKELPDYMIPSYILQLEKMPLTSNGKIDRRALPEPDGSLMETVEYESPRNELEEALVKIWADVLGVEGIGINHNFFELGGHSLKATMMVAKIHRALNIELPLKAVFKNQTIKSLGEYIKELEQVEYLDIQPIAVQEYYPLSSAQSRIYIQQELNQASTAYNMTSALTLEGDLNKDGLEHAINGLIERHEVLRTRFIMVDGVPMQRVEENVKINLDYIEAEEGELKALTEEFIKPFDLEKAPLLRVALVKTGESKHLLLFDLHHIISDGVSMNILTRDFMGLYEGRKLPTLRIQYKDYAAWHNLLLASDGMKDLENYWLGELEGYAETNLPMKPNFNRESKSKIHKVIINGELTKKINEYCRGHRTTKAVLFLSIFKLLIKETINQNEITLGIPVAGRRHAELQNIMGIFLNVLLFSSRIPQKGKFVDFLAEMKEHFMDIQEKQDYPYEGLHEKAIHKFETQSEVGSQPLSKSLFSILYNYIPHQAEGELHIDGLNIKPHQVQEPESKYSLTLYVREGEESIVLEGVYDHLVDASAIENILMNIPAFLEGVMAKEEVLMEELILPQKESYEAFEEKFKPLGTYIGEFAKSTPNKIAIERGKEQVTYRQLEAKTNQIAHFLQKTGASDGNIPVIFENSIELVEAILGIVKAGGVFAPVDPNFPQNRISLMLREIDAEWIITQGEWLEKLDDMLEGKNGKLNTLVLDDGVNHDLNGSQYKNLKIHSLEDVLEGEVIPVVNEFKENCYIYFTSGSTGKPKGILGRHNSLVHFIQWEINEFEVTEDFRGSQLTSPSFDPFLRDTLVPLCAGGTLCIPPSREIVMDPMALSNWLEDEKINLVHMVPTLFRAMMEEIEDGNRFKELKYILLAGELLRGADIKKFIRLFGKRIQLVNLYGPTETTLAKFFYRIKEEDVERATIPVGSPIQGAQALVLDHKLRYCGVEGVGEIYIRTPYISSGYYNNEAMTKEVFILNPRNPRSSQMAGTSQISETPQLQQEYHPPKDIIYKTGDTGRILATGELEVMGRVDHQVKIRGFRIEVGEIENRLIQYGGIKEAVVVAREVVGEGKTLWGYVTGENPPKMEDLKEYLGRELPEYMIPTYIIHLQQLPLTPNGKVDRKALPVEEGMLLKSIEYIPPSNRVERVLVEIWQEILGLQRISTRDDFFKIGGHSLKATGMTAKIHKKLNVEVPLKVVFENPTIKGIAEFIEGKENSLYSNIEPVEERQYYPVSSAQRRIYTLQQLNKDGVGYNISGAFAIEGKLDIERLEKTIKSLMDRHESLRTSFKIIDGEVMQVVHRDVKFTLEYHDELGADFIKPFQLSEAPLFRVGLGKVSEDKHMMILDLHHIIGDGTSMAILIEEFTELYGGKNLEPLRIQYKDYSHWQKELIQSGKIQEQRKYWLQQFEGEIPVLNPIGDYPRPAIKSFEGDFIDFRLESRLTNSLREICDKTGATMYMVLLAAFSILLSKYSGQEDLVVGSPIAGRSHDDLKNVIGMFVNTLAMRNAPQGEKTFEAFLNEVKKNALGAYENQDYQFEDVVEDLNLKRDLSRNPLFDVMFTMQNMDIGELAIEGLTITPYGLNKNISKFDLTLFAMEKGDGIDIRLEYATKLFKKQTMERLYRHLENILKQVTDNPSIKLKGIQLVSREEKQQLVVELNNTKVEYPRDKTIHQLFEEQVEKTPEKIAASFENQTLTYLELNKRANQLARQLMMNGLQEETIVGIMVEPSLEMLVGIIATLKAGGAYLPIDATYPTERINYMLADSGVGVLLTQSWIQKPVEFNGKVICLNNPQLYMGNDTNLGIHLSPNSLVYMIYTSGSTGRPKGVMIHHGGLVNYITWARKMYIKNQEETFALYSSLTFDLTVTSIYAPLVGGNQVIIYRDRGNEFILHRILKEAKSNIIKLTPAHLSLIKDLDHRHSNVKRLIVGGDNLTTSLAKEVYDSFGGQIEIFNEYGPTETVVGCMIYNYDPDRDVEGSVPIGKPADNVQIYLLDPYLEPVPYGVKGEIYIAGDGVARGYLNRPELTEERFIPNPFKEGEKMYRTGDLGKRHPDGNIEFLGRIDHQVKIRGYRIEIGEIENQLLKHPSIQEVIVVPIDEKRDKTGDKYLCGYIVAKEEVQISDLRNMLLEELPEYMVPQFILQLEEMPLTSNGKVDRKALPEPDKNILSTVEYEAPRNKTEELLLTIWREILAVEGIGINHDFFELGGHSLKATAMMAKIHKVFNVEISLKDIFSRPTIKGIGQLVDNLECSSYATIEVVEEKEYYPTSPAQCRLYSLHQFEKESVGYNMPGAIMLEGNLEIEKLKDTFSQLIDRHEALRTSFDMLEDEPVQYIHREVDFKLHYMEAEEEDLDGILEGFVKPFDLSQAPLLRVGLVKVFKEKTEKMEKVKKHLLIFDMHHIISDGISMGILINDFVKLYSGNQLESLKIQYKDYSQWQRDFIASGEMEEVRKYWLQQFEEEIPVLNIIGDYPRPALQSFEGDRLRHEIDKGLASDLRELCKKTGTTLYMMLLSAVNILLSKYSGQEDIIIGSPVAGRSHGDLENIIGMFVNTLAMRNYPKGDQSYRKFLEEVKENALAAYQHQDYQFEELVENLNIKRDLSRNPLFDVMFAMENPETKEIEIEGLSLKPYGFKRAISKFDITITAVDTEENINIGIDYATKIFKRETIERFYCHLINILREIVKDIDVNLSEIDMVMAEEKQQLLADFNDTKVDFPMNKTIHQLFAEQVNKNPNHVAVACGDEKLTYNQLNAKANQLARLLVEAGVKPDMIVGIMVERSVEMIVGIVGILKAGAAYLPIDPHSPENRIKYMLEDSGGNRLLTQSWLKSLENLKGLFDNFSGEVIELDKLDEFLVDGGNSGNSYENINSNNLAYVIYTSGSTGNPKGVMMEHRSVINLTLALQHRIYKDYEENMRVALLSPYIFDASVQTIFSALLLGHQLYIVPEDVRKDGIKLLEYYHTNKIEISDGTPIHLSMLSTLERKELAVKHFIIGGEALGKSVVEEIYNNHQGKNLRITNVYGPTECCVDTTIYEVKQQKIQSHENIPIGKPINNAKVFILNRHGELQPIGVAGELYISGAGLARGYLNMPQLTAEKFIDNPFVAGEKMYRTGDLARWLPDGNIEFLGRIDHQVKVRGYRIELGEIKSRLLKIPAVQEAVVLAKEEANGSRVLWGYITGKQEVAAGDIKKQLLKDLPEYMIPTHIIQLEKMPLTTNGKIDRKALIKMETNLSTGENYEAPRNEIEEVLVGIWQEILRVDGIGIHDNFFELGGHSLKATTMMAKIHKYFNVEIALKDIFQNPTIKEIGELIQATELSIYSAIEPVEERKYYHPSSAQRRLFTLQQFDQEGLGYNMPGAVMLEGNIDVEKIEATFKKLIERHEALRTSFDLIDGEPQQYIHKEVDFKIKYMESREENIEVALRKFVKAFHLKEAPLLRVGLVKIVESPRHLLIFDLHHVISDGVSMGILIKEFAEIHRGRNLEPLRIQYKDYSQWQRNLITSGKMQEQKNYWLQQLEGEVPVINLMEDYPRPAMKSFEGETIGYSLQEELTSNLREICRETGATMYMVLLAAFNVLLSKYSGQEDIIVGSPIAGRSHEDLSQIIGMFVNTLAMRNEPKGEKTFKDFLMEVKNNALKAYQHQDYQFEELVENLNLRRDTSRNPLFDVMFTMQNMEMEKLSVEGLSIKPYDMTNNNSKFDMTLSAIEGECMIHLGLEYATKIFRRETMERLCRHFEEVLLQITSNPAIRIQEIQLVTEAEKKVLLEEFNDTKGDYPKNKTIHQLFEAQVERTLNNVAVIYADKSLTYGELNQRANQLARQLVKKGVKKDTIVGIMVERSLEMMVGIMAIVKAGGAYLPIAPDYPEDRIKFMLEDSGAGILLTQSWLGDKMTDQINFEGEVIALDDEKLYRGEGGNLSIEYASDSLAYIIYTSGSTGNPKGVMIQHYSLINRLNWMQNSYPLGEEDVILQKTPFTFDVSLWEIFWWSMVGAKVCMLENGGEKDPSRLLEAIEENRVSIIHFVPSMLSIFLGYLEIHQDQYNLQSLRKIFASGEALTVHQVEKFNQLIASKDQCSLTNLYGPTEATVDVSYFDCEGAAELSNIPIGKPIDNIKLYILDKSLNLQPIGIAGELCIAGDGLARGYLNRPELTAEKFVDNPYKVGEKIYRTGDLARWLPDGNIEYLGRIDFQVKIRGYRIELGEIENRLQKHEAIKDVVVVDRKDQEGLKYLCAYIVTTGEDVTIQSLKEYLGKDLPDYMIPAYFVEMEKLPLSTNGKINRKALPEPTHTLATGTEYVAPENEGQKEILTIWQEVLGNDKIGIRDDFFSLGGDSFKALKVVSKLAGRVMLADVFKYPTVELLWKNVFEGEGTNGLLNKLTQHEGGNAGTAGITGHTPAVVCVPYGGGSSVIYKPLADALTKGKVKPSLYAVELPGHGLGMENDLDTVANVAEKCVEEIINTVKRPVILYSHCVGVAVTLEIARLLELEEYPVEAVCIGAILPVTRPLFGKVKIDIYEGKTDEEIHQYLKSLGGFDSEIQDLELSFMMKSFRHDVAQMRDYFYNQHPKLEFSPKLKTPIYNVVGEQDPLTKNYERKYKKWRNYSETIQPPILLKKAGHYYIKSHAEELAKIIEGLI